jgi:hypothetical protein
MNLKNKKIVHLFHCPSNLEYQESFLKMIALPTGASGKLKYDEKWLNEAFINEIKNINESNGFEAIFWVLSCKPIEDKNKEVINQFDFACPVRLLTKLNVKKIGNNYYINFIMKDFISEFSKIDNEDNLKKFMQIEFDDAQIPYPGKEKGLVHIGPEIEKIETTQTPSLEALYEVLKNIPCLLVCKDGITIKEYPLLKIEEIKNCKINKNGLYELNINQEYKITLSYYQREDYRNRRIYINDNRFSGRSGTENIIIEEKKKNEDKISKIVVKFDNLEFTVPLHVIVKIPWHKCKFTPLLVLFVLSAISFYIFLKIFPESVKEVKAATVFPLIVLCLAKIWEVLYK